MEQPSGRESIDTAIKAFAVAIITIAVIAFAVSAVRESTIEERSGTTYPYVTVNSTMNDNTYGVPTGWDNIVSENRKANLDNYGIANHFLQDNDNGACYWRQALVVSDLYDEIESAPVVFAYQVSDNSGLGVAGASHVIRVVLQRPGGDNVTVWDNSVSVGHIAADNSTWHTQENDMAAYINATGTYYIFLVDNAVTGGNANYDNVVVRWDNASLTINAYNKSVGETIADDTGAPTVKVFGLLFLVVVIGVALYLLRRFEAI